MVAKIEDTKAWLLKTVQKRKADRPAPVPGAKEHKHGNLTKIQELRLQVYVNQQLLDETEFSFLRRAIKMAVSKKMAPKTFMKASRE